MCTAQSAGNGLDRHALLGLAPGNNNTNAPPNFTRGAFFGGTEFERNLTYRVSAASYDSSFRPAPLRGFADLLDSDAGSEAVVFSSAQSCWGGTETKEKR
jgi:hypothetical protein